MLTRREFLQFVVGGAIGSLFSPLPWRLADEMALFSQRWTYQAPDGKETWDYTLCQLCPGGCGLKVRKIDERVVKVEGNLLNPVSRGGLCPLGMASVQLLYGDERRIKKPLKRAGAKGEDKWQEIGWDDALKILAQKLEELREAGEGYGLVCIDGCNNNLMSRVIKRFCDAYGTPNYLKMPSSEDATSLAIKVMQGFGGHVGFDLENSDYIISFGSQLLEGWGAPVRMQAAYAYFCQNSLKPKTKIVQIEPRMSDTASKAGEWLPIKPGTEAALALGFAHVIIKEGLYNKKFINNHAVGFSAFKDLVLREYSIQRVAEITGIASKEITRIAREFASAKKPVALWGRGKGIIPSGLYEVMAIHALNALVGNINQKGGVIFFKDVCDVYLPKLKPDNIAKETLKMERIDDVGTAKYPLSANLLQKFAKNVNSRAKYPIKIALIFEANPCYTAPQPYLFAQALNNIPFVVSFSTFMDETAKQADLILPTSFYLERWDAVTTPKGLQYPLFGVSKPVLTPLYQTKHPGDVLITISKKLGNSLAQGFPWQNYRELLKDVAKRIYNKRQGMLADREGIVPWSLSVKGSLPANFETMWDKLSACVWFNPGVKREGFRTRTGKFEFLSTELAKLKVESEIKDIALPHYEEWKVKGKVKGFPLTLIPLEILMLPENVGSAPYMIKTLPPSILRQNDLCVEVHPTTATENNLAEGDKVLLTTPFGKAEVRVHLYEGIMPGVVAIPLGLGHVSPDKYLNGKGVNAHKLLGYSEEKLTGIATWAISRANLTKI